MKLLLLLLLLFPVANYAFSPISGEWIGYPDTEGRLPFGECKFPLSTLKVGYTPDFVISLKLDCYEGHSATFTFDTFKIVNNLLLIQGEVVGKIDSNGFEFMIKFYDNDYYVVTAVQTEQGPKFSMDADTTFKILIDGLFRPL